jgi:hypothetical protein
MNGTTSKLLRRQHVIAGNSTVGFRAFKRWYTGQPWKGCIGSKTDTLFQCRLQQGQITCP